MVSDYRTSTPSNLKRHMRQESIETTVDQERAHRLEYLRHLREKHEQEKEIKELEDQLLKLQQPEIQEELPGVIDSIEPQQPVNVQEERRGLFSRLTSFFK